MSDNSKNDDFNPITEFSEKMFSAPCIALAGVIAMYITFDEYARKGSMPDTFLSWLLFVGTILFYAVGVIIALFVVYILGFILVGGITPNINLKYVNAILTIIILMVVFYYMFQSYMR